VILDVTTEQIASAVRTVYEPSGWQHAPAQVLMDHFAGDTTFLRVSFRDPFTHAAAAKLDRLRSTLKSLYGNKANVVFVVYRQRMDPDDMAAHAAEIARR
jgi:hypothetical protein